MYGLWRMFAYCFYLLPLISCLSLENRIEVLVVSTARSGSSLVGDLLEQLPNTLYSFEPCHQQNFTGSKCAGVVANHFLCQKELSSGYYGFRLSSSSCKGMNVVVKEVILSSQSLSGMLSRIPNLRVILLARHPIDVAYSQGSTFKHSSAIATLSDVCDRMNSLGSFYVASQEREYASRVSWMKYEWLSSLGVHEFIDKLYYNSGIVDDDVRRTLVDNTVSWLKSRNCTKSEIANRYSSCNGDGEAVSHRSMVPQSTTSRLKDLCGVAMSTFEFDVDV